MSDDTNQPDEPNEPDEPEDSEVQTINHVETAAAYHDAMDRMKHWSLETSHELRSLDEEASRLVESVYWRIERGDLSRSRRP
jgi:hypothetical protein